MYVSSVQGATSCGKAARRRGCPTTDHSCT